ncbi:haloacid dehalogenase-like hydrolase, partial [Pseudomonas aeruginosa]
TAVNGVDLWVNRKAKYMEQINGLIKQHSAAQAMAGLPVTADRNWVIDTPEQIQ